MGLGDVTLGFEYGHIVANGGTGDAELVLLHKGFGADGFVRGNEVGDDSAEDFEAAFICTCHGASFVVKRCGVPRVNNAVYPNSGTLRR